MNRHRVGEFPDYVYAYLDADGEYLYIGQTRDLKNREKVHRSGSPWLSRAKWRVVLSEHLDHAETLRAERDAIRKHRPEFNVMNVDTIEDLGPALRALRRSRGVILRELAQRVGCSTSYLSLIENGHRQASMALVNRIYAALGHEQAVA